MLFNWNTPKKQNIVFAQYGAVGIYQGGQGVTLEDLLECCEQNYAVLLEILGLLKRQGFRKEKISREQLYKQNNQVLLEIRNMHRNLRFGFKPGD